jgi:DNA-binding FadR family transcriptional regulator
VNPAQLLRDTLQRELADGTWRPGDRLPTERELAARHGLGRTAVRGVLQGLKDQGLITQTVGSGTYVSDGAAQRLQARHRAEAGVVSPAELMAARLVLEPAVIELVVTHATAADFARMEECLQRAEAATGVEAFERWDGALHEAIAEAAHNAFVTGVFRLMNEARAQGAWGALKRRSLTPERRRAYQREHRALVQALRARDAAKAHALCVEHLRHVRANLFEV